MMPQIVPTKKSQHDWKGKPSSIRNANRSYVGGQIIPINNGGGGLFSRGGNDRLGGGGNNPP